MTCASVAGHCGRSAADFAARRTEKNSGRQARDSSRAGAGNSRAWRASISPDADNRLRSKSDDASNANFGASGSACRSAENFAAAAEHRRIRTGAAQTRNHERSAGKNETERSRGTAGGDGRGARTSESGEIIRGSEFRRRANRRSQKSIVHLGGQLGSAGSQESGALYDGERGASFSSRRDRKSNFDRALSDAISRRASQRQCQREILRQK